MSVHYKPFLFRLLCLCLLPAAWLTHAAHSQTPTPPVPNTQHPTTNNPPATQSLGAFLTPIDARASSSQAGAGRTPNKLIDSSGWGETKPGTGVYVHTNNVGADGNCMWNGDANSWLLFDLGKEFNVNGVYVWNYNEAGGWNTRSVREVEISASSDNKTFKPVGTFTLRMASGMEDERGEAVAFGKVVKARWFKWQIKSNYRNGEMSGLSEVRFSNADVKAAVPQPVVWKPKYPRPPHPHLALGARLPQQENIIYPADAGIIDVSKPPYNAKGDGTTDDTAAIQKAFDDYPERNAIIYLPNGIYLVSNTLRWGGNEGQQRNTVLQGQSRAGTIIQLKDSCPGFDNPRKPKGVVYTGHAPAQRFSNEIHNLTIDTGMNNPGACGAQFIANNQGGMWDVDLVSGDGQGVAGLDMGYTDEQGPCLIKRVTVQGFDIGIRVATSVASETLEHLTVLNQNKFGFRNDGQPCTVRDLRSSNAVPAFYAGGGFTTMLDCDFSVTGAAADCPAVDVRSDFVGRNLRAVGYRSAISSSLGGQTRVPAGPVVEQFATKPASSLFGTPGKGLHLPVRETPLLPWDDLSQWSGPSKFGIAPDSYEDASDAIQKAIDSGATTIYLPRGGYRIEKTITIRGNVRRFVGCRAYLMVEGLLKTKNQPVFRFEDGTSPIVSLEGISTDFSSGPYFFLEHNAKRALVMQRLAINFQGAEAYRTGAAGTGDVYIEDVVGRYFHFRNQHLWARQFNPEGDGVHIENDGGTAWILGLKTEGGGPLLDLKHGSKTELLGGFSYSVGDTQRAPMFVIDNSEAALTFAEVCYTNKPFPIIVQETRNGVTKTIKKDDPLWRGHFTLYTAGTHAPQ